MQILDRGSLRSQQLDRVFEGVAKLLTEPVQQNISPSFASPGILLPHPQQQLFPHFLTHQHPPFLSVSSLVRQHLLLLPLACLSVS